MEWIKAITDLISSLAWPLTVITLVLIFKKELRRGITSLAELKFPGGSITMQQVEKLEATVEKSLSTQIVVPPDTSSVPIADPKLSVAQIRIDLEKELFRLSWRSLDHSRITGWNIGRHIDELERHDLVSSRFADALRSFIDVANRIIHGSRLDTELVSRSAAVGGELLSNIRYKRLVFEAARDFEGHKLYLGHRHLEEGRKKYLFWSGVVASLPQYGYDFEVYREAAKQFNSKIRANQHPGDEISILSIEEFVHVLEFREKELIRLIDAWNKDSWQGLEKANHWEWPTEWGNLGWNCPVIRERLSLFEAEQDLMQTRAALDRHRSRLLNEKRGVNGLSKAIV